MLIALWPTSEQFNDNNGSILTNGKIYVYYSGRAALAPTWSSADGSHVNSNPIILDNNGRAVAFADDQYTYTCVVCDFYGREMFSFDPASYGTGGGGSSGEGGPAQHWIGKSGATVSVPKLTSTTLPIPSNPDYEGDFATIIDNRFVLAPGIYMVDCLVDFRQSSSDLTNSMGSIKLYTSDSSDPIEGQIFERNETGPDASGASHQVQVSFVRHVAEVDDDDALRFEMTSSNDLTYARIDRLSIVKLEQGGGGNAYAAGYGIQIDGQVISTSGMMPESSAANFVNVETYNTDIQNIYDTIAETSAMIPSGVATEQFVEDYTSAFITEDALDGYATQSWVEDQHYITSADLPESVPLVAGEGISIVDTSASTIISVDSAYSPGVSEEWVEEYVSDYTSAFITESDIPADLVTSGELATVSGEIVNQIPDTSDMATKTWVGEQGYLTSLPADLVTSGELATVSGDIVSQIPSLDGYATQQWVEDQNYITSADIPDIPEDVVTSGEMATVSGDIMSQMPTPTTVSIDPTLSSGTKIADFNINGTSGELFAPEGGGGSSWSEEYVDIPWRDYSTTTTDWQTIVDYASAHGGMAPVGFCEAEGQVYYPTLFQPEYKTVTYVSIYKNPYDPSTTWRFSSKTLEQPFSTSYWRNFVEGFIGQSDWNQSNTEAFSYIQNKPDLPTSEQLVPSRGENGQVLTVVNGAPVWANSQGGGSVTFPLEVSGVTRVYEAVDTTYSAYLNSHAFGIEYHAPAGGEPEDTVTIIYPGMIFTSTYNGNSNQSLSVYYDRIELDDDDPDYGGHSILDRTSIDNWNSAYNAVNASATYWNSSIFSDQITSAALVNSLPADASAHPNYLYLIPEN